MLYNILFFRQLIPNLRLQIPILPLKAIDSFVIYEHIKRQEHNSLYS
jgi:hypothetical protein